MKLAYVDTSCLVAIAFGEPGSSAIARRLEACDRLLASNLVEAELLATFAREGVDAGERDLLSWLDWILPAEPLTARFDEVLAHGYLRGADLWHLACALEIRHALGSLAFLTLDRRQREVADALGMAG